MLQRHPLVRWLMEHKLASRFQGIEQTYAQIAMNGRSKYRTAPSGPLQGQLADFYVSGLSRHRPRARLPAFAHDFVIPSVSQALYVAGPTRPERHFLGNHVNRDATHVSGGRADGEGSDRPLVEQLLRDLAGQLPQ